MVTLSKSVDQKRKNQSTGNGMEPCQRGEVVQEEKPGSRRSVGVEDMEDKPPNLSGENRGCYRDPSEEWQGWREPCRPCFRAQC